MDTTKVKQLKPVLVYDGIRDHDRFLEWMHTIHQALPNFSGLFNQHLNEVLGSDTPFNHEWYVQLHNGKAWPRLEALTEEFVNSQNKAVRDSFSEYYSNCLAEIREAWRAYMTIFNSHKLSEGQKHFPIELIRPENLPFSNGNIDFDVDKIELLKDHFNEYLTDPDLIRFYNQLVSVRDAYNAMEVETKRLDMKFDLQPVIAGIPFFLRKDNQGFWQLKDSSLTNALTLKNH